MSRLLYFDCFSGVAGDMTLGALIDLGVDADLLREALRTLPVEAPWALEVGERHHHGIRGVDVHVVVDGKVEGPTGDHDHDHGPHYHYADIVGAIEGGQLPAPVVARAVAAFDALAAAEAVVHGVSREQVHFHEVGAVDGIIDIAGTAWGIWKLGVDRIRTAPPPISRGFVDCAHGRMPLPAPATLELLRGFPIQPCDVPRELVTPTGAALLSAWAEGAGPFPAMVVEGIGWGAGDLSLHDRPNLLRLVLGRAQDTAAEVEQVEQVETNLDDLNPELAGHLLERLLEAGALDAWFAPIQMKKQRPGLLVGALARRPRVAAVCEVLLRESSAIGLRHFPVARQRLDRRVERVVTPWGEVPMKVAFRGDEVLNAAPEYEACAEVARRAGIPLKQVYQHAVAAWVGRPK